MHRTRICFRAPIVMSFVATPMFFERYPCARRVLNTESFTLVTRKTMYPVFGFCWKTAVKLPHLEAHSAQNISGLQPIRPLAFSSAMLRERELHAKGHSPEVSFNGLKAKSTAKPKLVHNYPDMWTPKSTWATP